MPLQHAQRVSILIALTIIFFLGLAGVTMAAETQRPAPDFRLQDQNGNWHELGDFSDQWLVVYFYPRADTPGCTTQACDFRDNIYAFRGAGAQVVGISTDPVDRQKAFSEKYSLPFAILSDADGVVAERFGVLMQSGQVNFARRETFLISPDGEIVEHYQQVNPDRHSEQVLADLERAMAARGES